VCVVVCVVVVCSSKGSVRGYDTPKAQLVNKHFLFLESERDYFEETFDCKSVFGAAHKDLTVGGRPSGGNGRKIYKIVTVMC
jgi:hypothetical protein